MFSSFRLLQFWNNGIQQAWAWKKHEDMFLISWWFLLFTFPQSLHLFVMCASLCVSCFFISAYVRCQNKKLNKKNQRHLVALWSSNLPPGGDDGQTHLRLGPRAMAPSGKPCTQWVSGLPFILMKGTLKKPSLSTVKWVKWQDPRYVWRDFSCSMPRILALVANVC